MAKKKGKTGKKTEQQDAPEDEDEEALAGHNSPKASATGGDSAEGDSAEEEDDEKKPAQKEKEGKKKRKKMQKSMMSTSELMRLRSASVPAFTEKNPPKPRPMILPYIPSKLEQGVLEQTLYRKFLGNPLLENPKTTGGWRPNPWKGKRYGAGDRPEEKIYEEEIKIDPGKELTKKPPPPLKDPPHLCGSPMMEKMNTAAKTVADDTFRKYGAQVDPKRSSFTCFDMRRFPESDEELTKALGQGALLQPKDAASAFLRDQGRHVAVGLGPLYKKVLGELELEEMATSRQGQEDDEGEDERMMMSGQSPGSQRSGNLSQSRSILGELSSSTQLSPQREAEYYAKSNARLARFLGETYYADRLAGVRGSDRKPPKGHWVPRHRGLLGPERSVRDLSGTPSGRQDLLIGGVLPDSPPKVVYRGLLNQRDHKDQIARMQSMGSTAPAGSGSGDAQSQFGTGMATFGGMGAGGHFMTGTNPLAPLPKVTLWREDENSWLHHSREEMPPRPERNPADSPPPPPPESPKGPFPSVIDESAAVGTLQAWARDAVKMKSYREMAKAMRKGEWKAEDEPHGAQGKGGLQATGEDSSGSLPHFAQFAANQAKVGQASLRSGASIRHARFEDENPFAEREVVQQEWEGIEKNWLRTRLALTH